MIDSLLVLGQPREREAIEDETKIVSPYSEFQGIGNGVRGLPRLSNLDHRHSHLLISQ